MLPVSAIVGNGGSSNGGVVIDSETYKCIQATALVRCTAEKEKTSNVS